MPSSEAVTAVSPTLALFTVPVTPASEISSVLSLLIPRSSLPVSVVVVVPVTVLVTDSPVTSEVTLTVNVPLNVSATVIVEKPTVTPSTAGSTVTFAYTPAFVILMVLVSPTATVSGMKSALTAPTEALADFATGILFSRTSQVELP